MPQALLLIYAVALAVSSEEGGAQVIVAVAIRLDGKVWALPAPARHHDVIHRIVSSGDRTRAPASAEQGFVDSSLGFVSRERAREIAIREGHVAHPAHPRQLFSEDLW